MEKRVLFLGIGNPILRDDAIGFIILNKLKERIHSELFEFKTEAIGGWHILDIIKGYETVIIIDSIYNNKVDEKIGSVSKLDLEDFAAFVRPASPHDLNIITAIELGKKMGQQMPSRFIIFAINISPQYFFGDEISEELKGKTENIVNAILNDEDIQELIKVPI